jgi:exonuclease SbcC
MQSEYDNLFSTLSKIPKNNQYGFNELLIEDIFKSLESENIRLESDLNLLTRGKELQHAMKFNEKVENDILNFAVDEEKSQEILNKYTEVFDSTDAFINNIGTVLGTKSKDYLNTSQSLIQKYYRYLNPLPSNNNIKFDGDNGELNILIPFNNEEQYANVQHTLSSGQLNVLAISIFLAINESQKISKLDFLAIDDPIQNMDDVNRFAICDVLGSLKKQLILSTHDLDFVKLFIKKNEHIKSEIQLYILESPQLKSGKIKRIDFKTQDSI